MADFKMLMERAMNRQWQTVIGCPVGYKYGMIIAGVGTPAELTAIAGGSMPVAAYAGINDAGAAITMANDAEALNVEMIDGNNPSTSDLKLRVQPFKMFKRRIHTYAKNNHTTTANLTFYVLRPRKELSTTHLEVTSTALTTGALPATLVTEGIVDLLSEAAVQDSGFVHQHTATQTNVNTSQPFDTFDEYSIKPNFTPFDSSYFTKYFNVDAVKKVRMRAGDSMDIHFKLPDISFPEGIQPFLGDDYEAFTFSTFILVECLGDIGHDVGYGNGPAQTAANPELTREAALKLDPGASQQIANNSCFVDVVSYYDSKIRLYEYELQVPGTFMTATTNASDMAITLTENIHDLN